MKSLLEYLVKALVDQPQDVEVREIVGEKTTVYELRMAKEDMGKVIGKEGRTIKAIRIILSAAAAKENKKVILELLE
jgi:hypothetical protein